MFQNKKITTLFFLVTNIIAFIMGKGGLLYVWLSTENNTILFLVFFILILLSGIRSIHHYKIFKDFYTD